jgi:bacterioferritin-associated ferredoxin
MIVCVCARVSDRQIHKAVANGAHSLECLQFELGVALKCGNCADCASRILGEAFAHAGGGHAARHHPVHFLQQQSV